MTELIRNGAGGLKDFSSAMDIVPRDINMLERLGLIEVDYGSVNTIEFERNEAGTDLMFATARGAERGVAGDDEARNAFFQSVFFTSDKIIKPNEIQDLREFATGTAPVTLANRVKRTIARIQRNHALTTKKAQYAMLGGSTYAKKKDGTDRPNLVKKYQAAWEIPDADMYNGTAGGTKTVSLIDPALNPADEFELFRQHIVAKAGDDGDNYELIVLLGSGAFTALKNHPDYVAAYAAFASDVNPLRERLGGLRNNRVLEWQGVTYIEDLSGEIATNEGYGIVKGIENFKMVYAPADTNEHANQTAEAAYLFLEEEKRKTVIESETSFVCVQTRPELTAKYTFTIQ